MAWDPDEKEIEEAVAEGNVEWLAAVIRWYQDPSAPGRPAPKRSGDRIELTIRSETHMSVYECDRGEYCHRDTAILFRNVQLRSKANLNALKKLKL